MHQPKERALALICLLGVLAVAGCATPKIEAARVGAPKSVVIEDFPNLNTVATIQVVTTNWPAPYFSQRFDGFFLADGKTPAVPGLPNYTEQANQIVMNQILASPRPVGVGSAAAMGAAGGLVAGVIQASAEDTQRRAAEFPGLVRKKIPHDLREEVMRALVEALRNEGIQVRIAGETRNLPPRVRWPATDPKGEPIAPGPFAASPPVDADLLVQISPIALYAAPGPLNSYSPKVGIGLALFDGRTRQFLGWQAFPFVWPDSRFSYNTYDGLVADLDNAGPALRTALLSLVPQVVNVIAGKAASIPAVGRQGTDGTAK
jgi:hypothetical protein